MAKRQRTLVHYLLIFLSTCLLIGFLFHPFSSLAVEFKARNGKVIDTRGIPKGIVLKVREAQPSVSGFGYKFRSSS